MEDKPYRVTNLFGHTYGRFGDCDEAMAEARKVIEDSNYKERVFVALYDPEYGTVFDQEVFLA